ncbi:MAG: sugar phosphate isomerase/epimerase [Theionarchaea archaeon]|nr:sugar phosphate isomerase/epimerase [Theionarchaea archaeon]
MEISLFTQSLFPLNLEEAIIGASSIGYSAIELACAKPHLDNDAAVRDIDGIAELIRGFGLEVAALSMFNEFTSSDTLEVEIGIVDSFIEYAKVLGTDVIKLTPGKPASASTTEENWRCLGRAIDHLEPAARRAGIKLAFETHMGQTTDTLHSTEQFLEKFASPEVGLTLDFYNLAFSGGDLVEVVESLAEYTYHTHVKNGSVVAGSNPIFGRLDVGIVDYPKVIEMLDDIEYGGYLSIECLGPDARAAPLDTAKRDLEVLEGYLEMGK